MIQGPDKKKPLDVKSIFKFKDYTRDVREERELNLRMQELYEVLEADYDFPTSVTENIQYLAMLGAAGRLFEQLLYSNQKAGKLIFPFEFLSGLRSTIYHTDNPFSQLDDIQQRMFFRVIYAYCQHELNKVTGKDLYPRLSNEVDMSVINTPGFTSIVEYAITAGKQVQPKVKEVLLRKLAANLNSLHGVFQCFQENPGYLVNDDSKASLYRANVVRGSAVGTIMAWLSLDFVNLFKGFKLTNSEKQLVASQYQLFKKDGMDYRHDGLSIHTIVRKNGIKALSSAALQAQIDEAVKKCNVAKVEELLPRWERHPSVMKSIWMDDPAVGDWLMMAAKRGNLQLVAYLHPRCLKNSGRALAFVMAVRYGREKIVHWYFKNGELSRELLKYALVCARENQQHKIKHELERTIAQQGVPQTDTTELEQLTQRFQSLMASHSNGAPEDSDSLFSTPIVTITPVHNLLASSATVIPGVSYAKAASVDPTSKYRM